MIGQLVYVTHHAQKRRGYVMAIEGDLVRVKLLRTRPVVECWFRLIDVVAA